MSGNQSLERGLAVLDLFRKTSVQLGVREIARRIQMSPSAVQRIVNTLAAGGYLEQSADTRRYRLGHSILALATHLKRNDRLIALAEPELQTLAQGNCLNAFLGARRGGAGVYLLTVHSASPIVIRSAPGEPFALHSTALGKALLMGVDPDEAIAILSTAPLTKLTARTSTDPLEIIDEVTAARRTGYTSSIDENFVGVIAIGAPVRDEAGEVVAAISIARPRGVGPEVGPDEMGKMIVAAAERISTALGH